MSWFYRQVIRPALFARDSEQIHEATLAGLGWLSRRRFLLDAFGSFFEAPRLPVRLWGLEFPNPVGVDPAPPETIFVAGVVAVASSMPAELLSGVAVDSAAGGFVDLLLLLLLLLLRRRSARAR